MSKPKTTVTENPDGSTTVTTEMSLDGDNVRPIRDDVVEAIDAALGRVGDGSEVMHAMDPSRLVSFPAGGPPVWSVAFVEAERDGSAFTLLVTYGFSHIASPGAHREGIGHEYSLALPRGTNPAPWADALLRHLCRYVLNSGNQLRVGDLLPCFSPITRTPFPPEHHDKMPDTSLVGIMVASDPVLPSIDTAHGAIEVRRFVGVDQREPPTQRVIRRVRGRRVRQRHNAR